MTVLDGLKMAWTPTTFRAYCFHRSNMSRHAERIRQGELRVLEHAFSGADLAPELLSIRPKATAVVYRRSAFRQYASGAATAARLDLVRASESDSILLDSNGRSILEAIEGWASHPFVNDPEYFVDLVPANLPKRAAHLRRRRGEMLTRIALDRIFASYRAGKWSAARDWAIDALLLAPASPRLRDRGVIKVALRSLGWLSGPRGSMC